MKPNQSVFISYSKRVLISSVNIFLCIFQMCNIVKKLKANVQTELMCCKDVKSRARDSRSKFGGGGGVAVIGPKK